MKVNLKKFPFLIWMICTGTLLSRTGTSMSVPFLSIILHYKYNLDTSTTGLIVGASFISYVFGGVIGGFFSQRYGAAKIMCTSLAFYSFTFFIIPIYGFVSDEGLIVVSFFLINLLSGFCRSIVESTGQAMIANVAQDQNLKKSAFALRYTMANIGNAIGPGIGGILGFTKSLNVFFFPAILVFVYLIVIGLVLKRNSIKIDQDRSRVDFLSSIKLLASDKKLMFYTLGGALVYLSYVQHEATLGIAILQLTNNSSIYTALLMLNASLVIVAQYALNNKMQNKLSLIACVSIGCLLFSTSFFVFSIAKQIVELYVVGEILFTLGEICTLPLTGVFIDSIAPKEKRNLYFGVISLQYIGRGVGPILGGYLLQHYGVSSTFVAVGIVPIFAMLFYVFVHVKEASHDVSSLT
ncbi:MFS transporter [Enterobacter sp. ECC-019]|uniref:MFS transporter n=1 Tax=Enterobacter sp. ECC-019 TaxID=3116478 RepID=UPI003754BA9C